MNVLRSGIDDGSLALGAVLPSANSLSQSLGVNRRTVHAALDVLVADGLLSPDATGLRVVRAPGATASRVMEHAVAVVSASGGQKVLGHEQPGWLEYITLGVLDGVRGAGLHSVVMHPDRFGNEDVERLANERPRGVVLAQESTEMEGFARAVSVLQNAQIPVAAHGDAAAFARCDRVLSDQERGAFEVGRWLLARGARRVLQVWAAGSQDAYWYAPRRRGYERAMREAGVEPLAPVFVPILAPPSDGPNAEGAGTLRAEWFGGVTRHFVAHLVEHLVGPGAVDALMLDSDGNAFKAAAACRLCGREPNCDVLLAGYDNYWRDLPERAQEPQPLLVTVDKDNRRMGRELVQLLLDRVEGRLPPEPQKRLVAPLLVEVGDPS